MRYFFNVKSSAGTIFDREGQDIPSLAEARAEAMSVARDLIGRSLIHDQPVDWTSAIEVTDEDDKVDFVGFREAVGLS
jgi:hypothetical protein